MNRLYYYGAMLLITSLAAVTAGTIAGKAAVAAGTGKIWYYSGTLTASMTASLHDPADDCQTTALATIFENDRPANPAIKNRSSATITFQEKCVLTGADGGTTITYWFTTDAAHLYDGKTSVPIDPKKGVLEGTPVRTQPFPANLSPSPSSHGKAAIMAAYLPAFSTKAVTIVATPSGQVTRTVKVALKTLFISTPLVGVYKANRNGIITQFHGDLTFNPYYFEDQSGTMHVTWNLGYHSL
jgi:hypothetical protein